MWLLDPGDARRLLAACDERHHDELSILVRLLAEVGLTLEEAAALTWSDVNLSAGHLVAASSLWPGAGAGTATGSTSLRVPGIDLSDELVALLRTRDPADPSSPVVPGLNVDGLLPPQAPLTAELLTVLGITGIEMPLHRRLPGDRLPRSVSAQVLKSLGPGLTRDCVDPWIYVEYSARGEIKPCCKVLPIATLPAPGEVDTSGMEEQARRGYRAALLSGNLPHHCFVCPIRRTVPVAQLRERVRGLHRQDRGSHAAVDDHELAGPCTLRDIRVEINQRCNLRCIYCAVSTSYYDGIEMSEGYFEQILDVIRAAPRSATVHVSGHGETTFHPRWKEFCQAVIDAGHRPFVITNLARELTEDEVRLLASFGVVQVSLDSHDEALMRRIRRAVKPERVFRQVRRILAAAPDNPPVMSFSVGVYDPAIWTMPDFATELIALGVRHVTFWDLVEYPHDHLTKPIRRLEGEEQERARAAMAEAVARLQAEGVVVDIPGDLLCFDGEPLWSAQASTDLPAPASSPAPMTALTTPPAGRDARSERECFSVIIPTLGRTPYLQPLLDIVLSADLVGQVVLIDNADEPLMAQEHPKLEIHRPGRNLYVNPSWNLGASLARHRFLAIVNDDLVFPEPLFEVVADALTSGVGVIGLDLSCLRVEPEDAEPVLRREFVRRYGFGSLMFLERQSYVPIPDDLLVWCGDDWLFRQQPGQNYVVTGVPVRTTMGMSSGDPRFAAIKAADLAGFRTRHAGNPNARRHPVGYAVGRLTDAWRTRVVPRVSR